MKDQLTYEVWAKPGKYLQHYKVIAHSFQGAAEIVCLVHGVKLSAVRSVLVAEEQMR